MKFVFTLLLISFSSIAFSQMTFNDILKIYKMDMDQFEEYAISRGYEFYKFEKEEEVNGVMYRKINRRGRETTYLELYDSYYSEGKHIGFQTGVSSDILRIKTEMKKFGYKLYTSIFMKDNITKADRYTNGKFELSIYTTPPNENFDYAWYEIGFGKY